MSYPSEFQPDKISASSINVRNASNMSFSFSNSITLSKRSVAILADAMFIVFGGTANVTN